MRTPKPTRSAFPPSWKKWRALKAGELIRFTDRVIYRANGGWKSLMMGKSFVEERINPDGRLAHGYYFRRIA